MAHNQDGFGILLRDKIAELDAAESTLPVPDDPVERLRLAAQRAVQAVTGDAMLPRAGHQAYLDPPSPAPGARPTGALDVRF